MYVSGGGRRAVATASLRQAAVTAVTAVAMALLQSLAASLGGRWWRWVMAPTPADSRRVPLLLQRLASTRLRPVTIAALWLALVGALAALARASHVAGAPSKRWKQLHEDLRAAAADDETPEEKHVRPRTPFAPQLWVGVCLLP